jgi:hypothetical protein
LGQADDKWTSEFAKSGFLNLFKECKKVSKLFMVETLGILGNENLQGEAKFPALHFCRIFHAYGYTIYEI